MVLFIQRNSFTGLHAIRQQFHRQIIGTHPVTVIIILPDLPDTGGCLFICIGIHQFSHSCILLRFIHHSHHRKLIFGDSGFINRQVIPKGLDTGFRKGNLCAHRQVADFPDVWSVFCTLPGNRSKHIAFRLGFQHFYITGSIHGIRSRDLEAFRHIMVNESLGYPDAAQQLIGKDHIGICIIR